VVEMDGELDRAQAWFLAHPARASYASTFVTRVVWFAMFAVLQVNESGSIAPTGRSASRVVSVDR
jgi:hypothetical protein